MIAHPNCKINLGLHILSRRPDGYHDLETIFLPVFDLFDDLEIFPAPQFSFRQEGIPIDCPIDDNICIKAYRLLLQAFPDKVSPVSMRLNKKIPFGAGLGGGSSDAAFALSMLNDIFSLRLSPNQLREFAVRLGADCPFFIDNKPAFATGIGDQLSPLDFDILALLRDNDLTIRIVKPDDFVSTREAYANITPRNLRRDILPVNLCQAVRQPISQWRNLIVNDFEASVFPAHPAIESLKRRFYDQGALYASMSGSGSSVFAIMPRNISLN